MRKLPAQTRRRIVGVAVLAPLLFGGGYLGASAVSASDGPEVIEIPMVLDIPLVAVTTCDGSVVDGAEGANSVGAAVSLAAANESTAAGDVWDANPCSQLSARDLTTPLEQPEALAA